MRFESMPSAFVAIIPLMEFIVEKATEKDLEAVYECFLRSNEALKKRGNHMWDHDYPKKENFLEDISGDGLFIIKDGDKVIASLGAYLDPVDYFFFKSKDAGKMNLIYEALNIKEGKYLVLERLMVDPGYRGHSLGKLLLNHILEVAYPEYGQLAAVFKEDAELKPFYTKLGFSIADPFKGFEWNNPDNCFLIGRGKRD